MVICLERGADLHMAQLMPPPLTVSYFSKILISFTFLVPADLGSPGQRAVKRVCVCVCSSSRSSLLDTFAVLCVVCWRSGQSVGLATLNVAGSNLGRSAFRQQPWESCSHTRASVTKQCDLVPVKGQ